jgi:hypothetical protein
MGIFEEMLKQHEDSHRASGNKNKSQKSYDLKNYFNTALPKGTSSLKKRIRILPPEEGKKTSFTIMWGHEKKVDGAWKTFPCLKHEKDEECPLCQAREVLMAGGTAEEKELAKDYSPRKFYIIKVIDRDNEHEGVKFWRIKHNYKKEGIFDKIMSAIEDCGHDITHPETGRDLFVNIKEGTTGKAITIGYALDSTPLSADESMADEWKSDVRTWEDVYSVRGYDYLAIIVKGDTPVWDKTLNKFVGKSTLEGEKESDNLEDELSIGLVEAPVAPTTKTTQSKPASKPVSKPVSKVDDDDDDTDLPF